MQTSSDSHHDKVFREIAKIKSQAQKAGSIGDNIKITVNMLSTSIEDRFAIDTLMQREFGDVTITKRPPGEVIVIGGVTLQEKMYPPLY